MNRWVAALHMWFSRALVTTRIAAPHSRFFNKVAWSRHDWSQRGEEWTVSPEWKEAVVAGLIDPYVRPDAHVLEIGPGGGRWTEALLARASRVSAVDVTPACIEQCRARFAGNDRLELHLNDGASLRMIAPASVDLIFSFDVFVHLSTGVIRQYMRQFERVLKPDGVAIIHHARAGAYAPGWRSDVTADVVRRIVLRAGLRVVEQIETLPDGQRLYAHAEDTPDVVTIVARHAAARAD
jgi:SAM-dependent methyltransferase